MGGLLDSLSLIRTRVIPVFVRGVSKAILRKGRVILAFRGGVPGKA